VSLQSSLHTRATWVTLVLAGLLAGVTVTTSVFAAEVRGQMVLGAYKPAPASKAARPGFNWELDNGVKEVLRDRVSAARELAVVLVGSGESKAPAQLEVALSGGTLLPSTLVVRAGTTVRIRNDDEIGHELYAEGLDGFSAEATSPKAIRSVNLKTAGAWPLRDKLTPHARAHLHVLPDLIAVAKVESSGAFAFADVPPGKYTLKVLHGADEIASKAIEVGDKALTVDPLTLTQPNAAP
jgi:plastocyanin